MKVAIAIALFNGEKFLWDQLLSLIHQTRKADEVILCDDGSKDNTKDLVRRFILEHNLADRWFLYENPQNMGYIKNFYHAVSLSSADLVFLCDQDDIWDEKKIENMSAVLEADENIKLLSCRYGIIDGEGNAIHSAVESINSKQTGVVSAVPLIEIARATRWPGMTMCVRKDFFNSILPIVENSCVIHDMAMAVCATKVNGFYEMDYVGAFHRRHQNNAAREEHRVSRLLDLKRKLFDIRATIPYWEEFSSPKYGLDNEALRLVNKRLELLKLRETALKKRSLSSVLKLYFKDRFHLLRFNSFVCDLYLALFGKM